MQLRLEHNKDGKVIGLKGLRSDNRTSKIEGWLSTYLTQHSYFVPPEFETFRTFDAQTTTMDVSTPQGTVACIHDAEVCAALSGGDCYEFYLRARRACQLIEHFTFVIPVFKGQIGVFQTPSWFMHNNQMSEVSVSIATALSETGPAYPNVGDLEGWTKLVSFDDHETQMRYSRYGNAFSGRHRGLASLQQVVNQLLWNKPITGYLHMVLKPGFPLNPATIAIRRITLAIFDDDGYVALQD